MYIKGAPVDRPTARSHTHSSNIPPLSLSLHLTLVKSFLDWLSGPGISPRDFLYFFCLKILEIYLQSNKFVNRAIASSISDVYTKRRSVRERAIDDGSAGPRQSG